jgi:hypothetical protein
MSKRFGKKLWRLEIVWLDSHGPDDTGWVSLERARKSHRKYRIHSVGYVLADDKLGVTLAGTVSEWSAMGVIHIPAGAVVKRRRLR